MSFAVGLTLTFEAKSGCLWKTEFSLETPGRPLRSVRARDASIFPGVTGTFQWTAAVKALSELFLRYFLFGAGVLCEEKVLLRGGGGSPAASLDYALAKEPIWLSEMFGMGASGQAVARGLIKRINPERKRGGDVILMVNSRVLSPDRVVIKCSNGQTLDAAGAADLLRRISDSQKPKLADKKVVAEIGEDKRPRDPRTIEAFSFIPIYTGGLDIKTDSQIFGLQSKKLRTGEFVPCHDGVGVLVSPSTYRVQSAPDFLRQRRDRNINILAGLTEHAKELRAFRPTGLSPQLTAISDIAYVMSVHRIHEPDARFSEEELQCMAEPSILSVSDGRNDLPLGPRELLAETAHNADQDISIVNTAGLRCFITWANVILVSSGSNCVDAARIHRYELLLQRTWYRMHFLERLVRSGRTAELGDGVSERMLAAAEREYSELMRPRALHGAEVNQVTKTIFRASRIESLYSILMEQTASPKAA